MDIIKCIIKELLWVFYIPAYAVSKWLSPAFAFRETVKMITCVLFFVFIQSEYRLLINLHRYALVLLMGVQCLIMNEVLLRIYTPYYKEFAKRFNRLSKIWRILYGILGIAIFFCSLLIGLVL